MINLPILFLIISSFMITFLKGVDHLKRFCYNVSGYKKDFGRIQLMGKLGISIYPERSTFKRTKNIWI